MYYHARSVGPDVDALKAAFKKCGEIAKKNGFKEVGLAVPTTGNLDGVISDVIGVEATRLLLRDRKLVLKELTIHLITKRIKPKIFSGPVLAVYTPIEQTKELATSIYCKVLVYVPWTDDEAPKFEKAFKSEAFYEMSIDLRRPE